MKNSTTWKNSIGKIEAVANRVVQVAGAVIFAVLVWYSMRFTYFMMPGADEISVIKEDSVFRNLFCIVLAIAGFWFVRWAETKVPEKYRKIISWVVLAITLLWTIGFGMWWITTVDRQPGGDQAYVYGAASYFLDGNYSFLYKTNYCGIYPHQLNLIFLIELLYLLAGSQNYFAFQVVCVFLSAGTIAFGYGIVCKLLKSRAAEVCYCGMMLLCLPLLFYNGWVYGEIPSVFCMMALACFLLMYEAKGQKRYLAGMVIAAVLAVMVRQNSVIMLIALGLVGLVAVLLRKDKKLLVALALAAVCPFLVTSAVSKMYEIRSGYEHSDGLPAYSHISMGLQESACGYGWYSVYGLDLYARAEYDTQAAAEIAKQDIANRLQYMKENPSYTVTFFREKVLSQWNAPLYQSLYFSNKYYEGLEPAPDALVSKISHQFFPKVLGLADVVQFVVFVGMLSYFLLCVRKGKSMLSHVLAVTIIGGFFFSMMWEAKARYIFPYYVMMFPMAVAGYWNLTEWLKGRYQKLKSMQKGQSRTNKIVKFRKRAK